MGAAIHVDDLCTSAASMDYISSCDVRTTQEQSVLQVGDSHISMQNAWVFGGILVLQGIYTG